jgi:hypothetical protein
MKIRMFGRLPPLGAAILCNVAESTKLLAVSAAALVRNFRLVTIPFPLFQDGAFYLPTCARGIGFIFSMGNVSAFDPGKSG